MTGVEHDQHRRARLGVQVDLLPSRRPNCDLDLVEAIAQRVVELLDDRVRPTGLVDAQRLSELLGVARSTVYEHQVELGGVRLGDGPRAPVRFDVETALKAWTCRYGSGESQGSDLPVVSGVSRHRRRAAARSTGPLLPVRGT
jgi:hypothetical protein